MESTGEVLDPDLVATLTEPFRRGDERTRSDDSGVGLGLAIVDRVVRAHGGTLTLRARARGGLHVRVLLPSGPQAGPSPSSPSKPISQCSP